jgi:hypothetical protein
VIGIDLFRTQLPTLAKGAYIHPGNWRRRGGDQIARRV